MSDRTPGPVKATETAEVVSAVPNHPPTHICTCGDADVHGNPVDQANAEFLALAWNCHDDLLAVAEMSLTYLSNVNTFEPEDVPRAIIAAMKKAGVAAPDIGSIIGTACAKPGREKINADVLSALLHLDSAVRVYMNDTGVKDAYLSARLKISDDAIDSAGGVPNEHVP